MQHLLERLCIERMDSRPAAAGIVSLPLPRETPGLRIDHPAAATIPVGWWKRHQQPRRVIAYILEQGGLPERLQLTLEPEQPSSLLPAWEIQAKPTIVREAFKAHSFTDIEQLRGVPANDCATAQSELHLTFQGRTLILQAGATGPKGGPYYWENVQVDPLWQNRAGQAIRAGGIIYNEDTYLWADLFIVLLRHGVMDLRAHFINTKLHIKGYDFQGLPLLRLAGNAVQAASLTFPRDGLQCTLGSLQMNLEDSAILFSLEHPGRIEASGGDALWFPVSRICNPQVENSPSCEWPPGFARTVRLQMSLSDSVPRLSRYRVPPWWYALCQEPWPFAYLPARGNYGRLGEILTDHVRKGLVRGRFDGGSGKWANDGDGGVGMMQNYYHTGRPEILEDAIAHCYYWADIAVDHNDFTVHQWVGGWGWKTCAYTKFRDILYGYLETGDPYLLDTVEMVAEAYWTWFRANWPRASIGRDTFELGGWALLWRFFRSEHAKERTLELVRMCRTVLDSRGNIGGQIGAGPHPGYLSSLYMTGVAMLSVLEAAEAAAEEGDRDTVSDLLETLRLLDRQFMRDDREMFPSNYGEQRKDWNTSNHWMWAMMALRIYPEIARLQGHEDARTEAGLRRALDTPAPPAETWAVSGRHVMYYVNPLYADAMLLGARISGHGIDLTPLGPPKDWPHPQAAITPFGELVIHTQRQGDETTLRFESPAEFPLRLHYGGQILKTGSRSRLVLPASPNEVHPPAAVGLHLAAFTARGFPGNWDEELARTPVAGIDRFQCQNAVRLCPETEPILYGPDFTPTRLRYLRGSRPLLEQITAGLTGKTPKERVLSAMKWVSEHIAHPHFTGPLAPGRALTEEHLIQSGRGWCNEQVRVFLALCQVMEVPARICFLFHANGVCGHTAAEVYWDGRWAFADATFQVHAELPDGRWAEGRELSAAWRKLAHQAYRQPLEDYERRVLPFVDECPGWGKRDRPRSDRGGDLLATLGICNYIIDGARPSV